MLKCIHHWIIDSCNVGLCKYCGEVRDFEKMRKGMASDRKEYLLQLRRNSSSRRRGRPKKEVGNA